MNLHPLVWDGISRLFAQYQRSFWMPPADSTAAPGTDRLFYFILYVSVFFFVLIVGLMTYFVFKYRQREGHVEQITATHHTPLEITWTVIPLILVLFMFYYGFKGYVNMYTPPANAYEVDVTAMQWKWLFTYPNGHVDENLHVPVNEPVRLVMTSQDVIHSLYIPNFRLKLDVVPGRYSKTWFQATEPGTYNLFCAEYCGMGHSNMHALVIVHKPGDFEKWLAGASNIFKGRTPAEVGAYLYKSRGCSQCHTIDGSASVGPSFKGVFGHVVKFSDGSSEVADENYVRQSILDPAAKVVAGFQPVMPTFQGKLKDKEITAIIAYLKTLSDYPGKKAETETETTPKKGKPSAGESKGETKTAPKSGQE